MYLPILLLIPYVLLNLRRIGSLNVVVGTDHPSRLRVYSRGFVAWGHVRDRSEGFVIVQGRY
jgi:hypothetical protein